MHLRLVHEVPAPVERVFAVVTDVTRRPQWVGMARERSLLGGPVSGEGARYHAVDSMPGRTLEYTQTIDRLEPPRLLEESWDGPIAGRSSIRFSGDDSSTTLDIDAELASPLPDFLSFLEPIARRIAKRTFERDLARLDDLVS